MSDQRQPDLALENARLRERLAELERRAVVAAPAGVRYGMDGMPHPTTTRRTFGRLIAFLLFLLGIGLGFGLGSRRAIADVQAGIRDGWSEGGGAAAGSTVQPGK